MKINIKITHGIVVLMLSSTLFTYAQKSKIITISNPLKIDREFETVEIAKNALGLKSSDVFCPSLI